MAKGVYAALSGAVMAETALEVTAQNLANTSSAGYQKLRPVFREVLSRQDQGQAPGQAKARPGANHFAVVGSTVMDTSAGVIRSTGRNLDVVLPEGAYLAVTTERGERYTRAGSIAVDSLGQLHAGGGLLVDESGKAITVPTDHELSITADGQIMANGESLSRLRVVSFQSPEALTPEGSSLLAAPPTAGGSTVTDPTLKVGAIEESNASAIGSMTEMMTVTRLFDAFKRAIDTFNDADRRIAGVHGN